MRSALIDWCGRFGLSEVNEAGGRRSARLPPRTIRAMADSDAPVPAEFVQALRELGLAGKSEPATGTPLTGGVSSDIWRIHTVRGTVCAKRALSKLRVA